MAEQEQKLQRERNGALCMEQYAQKVFDSADIVRDAMFEYLRLWTRDSDGSYVPPSDLVWDSKHK